MGNTIYSELLLLPFMGEMARGGGYLYFLKFLKKMTKFESTIERRITDR